MATHSMKRSWLAALAALAVLVAGCSGSDDETAAGSTTTAVVEADSDAVAQPGDDDAGGAVDATEVDSDGTDPGAEGDDQPLSDQDTPAPAVSMDQTVTLVDPGAEPRQELVLQWEVGDVQTETVSYSQVLAQEIDGNPLGLMGSDPLTILVGLRSEVTAFDGELYTIGQTIVSLSLGEGADPNLAAGFGAIADQLSDLTITQVFDRSGGLRSVQLGNLEALDPSVRATVEPLTTAVAVVPLPSEPVGPGAVWTVTQDRTASGLVIESTTTASLQTIDGSTITLQTSEAQSVPDGATIELAPGQPMPVISWDFDGSSFQEWDLTEMLPSFQSRSNSLQRFQLPDGIILDQTLDVSTETVTG